MESKQDTLPAQIASAIISIPKELTPSVVKALDRLLAAAIDIPVAKLNQLKARIDTQTDAIRLVEASIASSAALSAGDDAETVHRAMKVLVRKEYRKQENRDAVASAMIKELNEKNIDENQQSNANHRPELDDDWLNVFERYAQDASSEHLQGLWGRVLAGEICRPGRFSARTLRFFSEFSQSDALNFEDFVSCSFCGVVPKSLFAPVKERDVDLALLEHIGLVSGTYNPLTTLPLEFNDSGYFSLREDESFVFFRGEPGTSLRKGVIRLSPLGQELISLVSSRNIQESAKIFAFALRSAEIKECRVALRQRLATGKTILHEQTLWVDEIDPALPPKT